MKKGKIKAKGVIFNVKIENEVYYVDDKPMDEFLDSCDPLLLVEFVKLGIQVKKDKKRGKKVMLYQDILDVESLV